MFDRKNWLTILCCFCVLLMGAARLQVQAETIYTEKYFKYKVIDESIAICGYFGREKEVTIPPAIAGYPVSVIAKGAFIGTSVEKLYLPDTIMEIEPESIPLGTELVYNSNIKKEEVSVTVESVVNAASTESISKLTGAGTYYKGDTVTVTAFAKVGYEFLGWYEKAETGTDYLEKTPLSTEYAYTFSAKKVNLAAVYAATDKLLFTLTETEGVSINGAEAQEVSYFEAGTEVTVSYAAKGETDNFLYWKNASGKIVSSTAVYTFSLVNNTTLTPVVKSTEEGTAFVEFLNEYKQILSASVWTSVKQTEDDKQVIDVYKITETTPFKLGHILTGWKLEGSDTHITKKDETEEEIKAVVLAAMQAGESHIRLVPVYEKVEEQHRVIYKNNSENAEQKIIDVGLGTTCTVNAADVALQGQQFSHWINGNDEVVSYHPDYTFLVTSDVELTAVFVETNEAAAKKSILDISSQYEIKNGDVIEKVAFAASREIAEGYTLLEHGILYVKDADSIETEAFTEGTDGVHKFTASGTAPKGVFTLNIKIGTAASIQARAYAIVKNQATGEVSIIYSTISRYNVE